MSETGVVKFRCDHDSKQLPEFSGLAQLNDCRRNLFELRLIGVDANDIGYGNISVREPGTNEFYISGSGTGKIADLTNEHYAKVTAYDFAKNWLHCQGGTIASSESLTHAAVYESSPATMAVIHVHDLEAWAALENRVPATGVEAEYGTPAMARAVQQLFATTDVAAKKLFIMAAHEGGIVAFGASVEEAFNVLTRALAGVN